MDKFTNKDFDLRLIEIDSQFKRIGEYINAKSKVDVQCKCGNIISVRASHLLYEKGQKMCKQCANKKATSAMKKAKTLTNESVDIRLQNTNFTRIEDYKGICVPILFKCSCGITQKLRPKTIFNGKNECKYCKNKNKPTIPTKFSKDDIQKLFDENEIGFIVLEYKNSNTPILVKCKRCKETSKVSLSNALKKKGKFKNTCVKCRYDYLKGENNPYYNPNLTNEDRTKMRNYLEYRNFIKDVLERDNYTCFITNIKGGDLEVHHINGYEWYKEGRVDINNGITLSKEVHRLYHKIYGYKNANEKDFKEFCKIYKI